MFQCQLCGAHVPPRTRPTRIVVKRRKKQYPYRPKANVFYRHEKGKVKRHEVDDPGGSGWEIDQEILACPACAGEWEAE
jgi:hypothetical protein